MEANLLTNRSRWTIIIFEFLIHSYNNFTLSCSITSKLLEPNTLQGILKLANGHLNYLFVINRCCYDKQKDTSAVSNCVSFYFNNNYWIWLHSLKSSFNDVPNPWDLACPTASPTRQRIPSYAARAWQSTRDIVPFLADASSPSPNLVEWLHVQRRNHQRCWRL